MPQYWQIPPKLAARTDLTWTAKGVYAMQADRHRQGLEMAGVAMTARLCGISHWAARMANDQLALARLFFAGPVIASKRRTIAINTEHEIWACFAHGYSDVNRAENARLGSQGTVRKTHGLAQKPCGKRTVNRAENAHVSES